MVGFFNQTSFPIETRPTVVPPFRIDLVPASHGFFRVQFPSVPGGNYSIEASSDLIAWQQVLLTNATSSSVSFLDPDLQLQASRYYRARLDTAGNASINGVIHNGWNDSLSE
jgi:hypothetical protein